MKFRNIIRMQVMILAGLGVAMLFAGSAYAQQEMDPTPFADGPYVEPMPSASAGHVRQDDFDCGHDPD